MNGGTFHRMIMFEVPGIPLAKAKTVGMRGGHAMSYNKAPVKNYMALVRMAATDARLRFEAPLPFDGPVNLCIVAVFPRPKRLLGRYRDGTLKGGAIEGRMPMPSKPDLANLIKGLEDGINGSGLWTDDCQVCGYDGTRKCYGAIGEVPHVEVMVSSLPDIDRQDVGGL